MKVPVCWLRFSKLLGFYLYIGITLSDCIIAQRNRKSNTENCTKLPIRIHAKGRKSETAAAVIDGVYEFVI